MNKKPLKYLERNRAIINHAVTDHLFYLLLESTLQRHIVMQSGCEYREKKKWLVFSQYFGGHLRWDYHKRAMWHEFRSKFIQQHVGSVYSK